jgi:hypothetical protein
VADLAMRFPQETHAFNLLDSVVFIFGWLERVMAQNPAGRMFFMRASSISIRLASASN